MFRYVSLPVAGVRVLWMHLCVGYTWWLLAVDIVVLVGLFGTDVVRFESHELSLLRALANSPEGLIYLKFSDVVLGIAVGVVVLPLVMSTILVGSGRFYQRAFGFRLVGNIVVHLMLCSGIVYAIVLEHAMERLSGSAVTGGGVKYAFQGWMKGLLTGLAPGMERYGWYALILIILPVVVHPLLKRLVLARKGKVPPWIRVYYSSLQLAYYGADTRYKRSRRQKRNFLGVVSPRMRYLERAVDVHLGRYEALVAGSAEAGAYLEGTVRRAVSLFRELFLSGDSRKEYSVSLLPGTTRALEVAICRCCRGGKVILSPIEHPAERVACEWLKRTRGITVEEIDIPKGDLVGNWENVLEVLARETAAIVGRFKRSQGRCVLVLSEVWWATGLRIPVRPIVDRVRKALKESGVSQKKFVVVVDGAHGTGNTDGLEFMEDVDAYVCSGHKWLLTPEPIGIIITKGSGGDGAPAAYDEWRTELPVTTASARAVASLYEGLKFIDRVGPSLVMGHARAVRDTFLERVEGWLDVVGRETGLTFSSLVSVRPAVGWRWAYAGRELGRYLRKKGVHAFVMEKGYDGVAWVRLAFPYYCSGSDVNRLIRVLRGAVREGIG